MAGVSLTACASVGASGPSRNQIMKAGEQTIESAGIKIVDVNDTVARQVLNANQTPSSLKRSAKALPNRR
nr:hypothetical protein [Sphingomonas sediminicola]